MIDFKLRALFNFISITPKIKKRLHPEDAYFLCETLDFLFEEVSLTRNLLPAIRTGMEKVCWSIGCHEELHLWGIHNGKFPARFFFLIKGSKVSR